MKSVTIEVELGVYRVIDQDGTRLEIASVTTNCDGDLIVEVEVPYAPQCSRCRCRCCYDD